MNRTAFKKPKGNEGVAFQTPPFNGANLVAFQTPLSQISDPSKIKITLTHHHSPAKMTPYCKSSRGCGNPFRTGDKTPHNLAVFLCLSFFRHSGIHIMMGLFGQSLRLVAPVRGITTPFSPVTNTVVSSSDGFTHFRTGITA